MMDASEHNSTLACPRITRAMVVDAEAAGRSPPLAGAWRACRADLRSRDECEILAQQQIEASLTSTPPEFETLVGQCMETRLTSLHCQAGAQQAEEMLKSGALPKLLEAQQIFETVR